MADDQTEQGEQHYGRDPQPPPQPLGGEAEAEWASVPEFTEKKAAGWINSKPLSVADLRGRVVLIDVWTFEWWNCYRSFPWLKSVQDKYGSKGLTVIGVHSPEYERERHRDAVVDKVREFSLEHPVMIDNDFSYWNVLGNRYWPAYYLIDKQGRIRNRYFGETHEGDPRAMQIETAVERLLAEGR